MKAVLATANRDKARELAGLLEGFEVVLVGEREGDVVEAVEEPVAGEVVEGEGLLEARRFYDAAFEVHGELCLRVLAHDSKKLLHRLLGELDGEEAYLGAVVLEDVGEGRGYDGAEAVVLDGPGGVLPAGPAPEVLAGEEDDRVLVLGLVEHELGVLAPGGEEELAEAGPLDALEGVTRHDLVRVYVVPPEREGFSFYLRYGFH